jgi:hypothetical protein
MNWEVVNVMDQKKGYGSDEPKDTLSGSCCGDGNPLVRAKE